MFYPLEPDCTDTITIVFLIPLWHGVILLCTNSSHQLNKQVNIRLKLKVLSGILHHFPDCLELANWIMASVCANV